MSRLRIAVVCASTVLIAGCSGANAPEDVAGVRAMYRSIGLDAGAGDFTDVCRSLMVQALREQVRRDDDDCLVGNSTSNLERWAEKVRLAKVSARTRIAVSGREALVYDGVKPEKALYVSGQWLLAEAPELTSPPRPAAKR
jgi:hypothetical protein